MTFTAIVLAADRGARDPVARAAGTACKALAPVAGRAMVLRVLDALAASDEVSERVLCGPPQEVVAAAAVLRDGIASGGFRWCASRATPATSTHEALQGIPDEAPVLVTTADHGLLSPELVDYFCTRARQSDYDVVVALVPFAMVAQRYPGTRRTVLRFRDGRFCSCNLFAFLNGRGRKAARFWQTVEGQRKRPIHMMRTIGWGAVVGYLLGRLSSTRALEILSQRIGARVGAVIVPYAQAAVDVDTVEDWQLVNSEAHSSPAPGAA